jgi:AhpD family alkylhydroperoxidase
MAEADFSQERIKKVRSNSVKIASTLPEVMKSFYGLNRAAFSSGILDTKTKELIALAISVATHCDDCIAFHTHSALEAGASRQEILEMLGVAVFMGGGPALMYATHVIEAMQELEGNI